MPDRHQLLNEPEALTFEQLELGLEQYGIRVYPKIRLIDALRTLPGFDLGRLDANERDYCFKAHLDFFAQDLENGRAFAVEFDGISHIVDPATVVRDAMKNSICYKNHLDLLRIDGTFFQRVGPYRKDEQRWSLVRWIAEVWVLERSFNAAQEAGQIPEDEPFCWFGFFDPKSFRPTHDPFHVCHQLVRQWDGKVERLGPFTDDGGNIVSICVITAANGQQIIGMAKCKPFHFATISGYELSSDLAFSNAAWKFHAYSQGRDTADDPEVIADWRWRLGRYAARTRTDKARR